MQRKLLLATRNPHKAAELGAILAPLGWTVEPLSSSSSITWDETGTTFEANARIKAQMVAQQYPSEWILADDSGLSVEALGGAPGVYSSSFGGIEGDDARNRAELKRRLVAMGLTQSPAFFVCCLLLRSPEGVEQVFLGTCHGQVTTQEQGTQGFGYDPMFVPDHSGGNTMAELSPEIKNQLSHRHQAVKSLVQKLSTIAI